jgi:hypothetical protein
LYEVAFRDTPEGVRLFWKMKEDRKDWRELREGAYMLRANLEGDTARCPRSPPSACQAARRASTHSKSFTAIHLPRIPSD